MCLNIVRVRSVSISTGVFMSEITHRETQTPSVTAEAPSLREWVTPEFDDFDLPPEVTAYVARR
jgi:hypothetical protein